MEIFEHIDPRFISEAEPAQEGKRRRTWRSWGAAAACLCLVAAFGLLLGRGKDGGQITGGGNTATYSVAVYPAGADVRDVETAQVTAVSEEEALRHPLAAYLPSALPEGFHFGRGSLYETVMRDGTRYHLLRIEYITGVIPERQFAEDGGEIVPDPGLVGEQFLLTVTDYPPDTERDIVLPGALSLSLLEDAGVVFVQYGDRFVGVSRESADAAAVLYAVSSIG